MKYRNRIIGYRVMKVSELTANPKNWRLHPDKQRRALETILGDVGWVGAALYNEQTGLVIDGHLRAKLDDEIPVLITDLNEEEERKVLATLDPIAALAGHDTEAFQALTVDMDLELRDFFTDEDFTGLFEAEAAPAEDAGPQMDRAAELQEVWQVQAGDVWEIASASVPGKSHRLACGDCTDAEVVARLMGDERPQAVITDPPYSSGARTAAGVASRNNGMQRGQRWAAKPLVNDQMTNTGFIWLIRESGRLAYEYLVDGGGFISFIDWRQYPQLYGAVETLNFRVANLIVWDKEHYALGSNFRNQHELAIFASKGTPQIFDKGTPNVLTVKRISSSEQHPSEKPPEIIEKMLNVVTGISHIILDPFLGSGTTMVAAERTARLCYGIEIEPKYCAVILQRLTDLGLSPRRVDSLGS